MQRYVHSLDAVSLKSQLVGPAGAFGHTPLHLAAAGGRSDVLEFLLSRGGDANSQNAIGCTPLHVAAYKGDEMCVRVLLKYNCDVFRTDHRGKIPAQIAKQRRIVRLLISAGKYAVQVNKCLVHTLFSLLLDVVYTRCIYTIINLGRVMNDIVTTQHLTTCCTQHNECLQKLLVKLCKWIHCVACNIVA